MSKKMRVLKCRYRRGIRRDEIILVFIPTGVLNVYLNVNVSVGMSVCEYEYEYDELYGSVSVCVCVCVLL